MVLHALFWTHDHISSFAHIKFHLLWDNAFERWFSLQSLDLSPLDPMFLDSGIWARLICVTFLFWIRKWTSADSCDELPYMWVCGCLFLYLDFMRTGWAGAIYIQTLAIGSSHLQAMLLTIFRMTVHMVLLMFIFILEFYVYEAYILTPNRFAATLMRNSSNNSTIVGVLVYTFLQLFIYFIYFSSSIYFRTVCYPLYSKVTNHTTWVTGRATSVDLQGLQKASRVSNYLSHDFTEWCQFPLRNVRCGISV